MELTGQTLYQQMLPLCDKLCVFFQFEKWLDDGVRVRQVLRQHMLVGEFHTENLLNQSIFYTLQGVGAQLQAGVCHTQLAAIINI